MSREPVASVAIQHPSVGDPSWGLSTGRAVGALIGVLICLFLSGCREKVAEPEFVTIEGRIEDIKLRTDTTGEVSVLYYNQRRREEVVGTGRVTEQTEILINGAIATLADLRVGDRVRGDVRIEENNGRQDQIAVKIYVERPKVSDE